MRIALAAPALRPAHPSRCRDRLTWLGQSGSLAAGALAPFRNRRLSRASRPFSQRQSSGRAGGLRDPTGRSPRQHTPNRPGLANPGTPRRPYPACVLLPWRYPALAGGRSSVSAVRANPIQPVILKRVQDDEGGKAGFHARRRSNPNSAAASAPPPPGRSRAAWHSPPAGRGRCGRRRSTSFRDG